MNENQDQLLQSVQTYISDLFENNLDKDIRFHTIEHTEAVVAACKEIADYYQLHPDDRTALIVAAWFHDTGFSSGQAQGHEDVSISLATTFLQEHKAGEAFIKKVTGCIQATKMPQSPNTLLEQIICDADLFHLGTDQFAERSKLLRSELNGFSKQDISKKQWRKMNISFLQNHKYFTDYCRRKLQPVKEKNLEELLYDEKAAKKKKRNPADVMLATFSDEVKKETETKKTEKIEKTEREATAIFRIMAQNQNNLSRMADEKSHIMISVNSIILSVVVSFLGKELKSNYYLIYPATVLVTTGVMTMVFSILATRPTVTSGKFTREEIQCKKTNLFFLEIFSDVLNRL